MKVQIEIKVLRAEIKRLRRENARRVFAKDIKNNGKNCVKKVLAKVKKVVDIMNDKIVIALERGGTHEEVEIYLLVNETWLCI